MTSLACVGSVTSRADLCSVLGHVEWEEGGRKVGDGTRRMKVLDV